MKSDRTALRMSAAIVALAIGWLPIHVAVCRFWHLDPWKFGGWGMYSTPRPITTIEDISVDSVPLRPGPAVKEISTLRSTAGVLVPISRVARTIAGQTGGPTRQSKTLRFTLRERTFDGSQGRYVVVEHTYWCDRALDQWSCNSLAAQTIQPSWTQAGQRSW